MQPFFPKSSCTNLAGLPHSAASAANAVVDTVRDLTTPTASGDWRSVAVCSDGSYGVKAGLMSSFPVVSDGSNWQIVPDLEFGEFSRNRIDTTVAELLEEKAAVEELLP